MAQTFLCVHGHFYQPPRQNPFTGTIDREPGAAPYHDFNEKIWAECYCPNAEEGNLALMSFDLGPTLASWLQAAHPATLKLIVNGARTVRRLTGVSNAMAQSYHHTILPLATEREKRLQIAWGIRDFRRLFGFAPQGMWLPETAVDDQTLDLLAAYDIRFTILAPWQAGADGVDTTEPYRVELGSGRSISVFFYNAPLSGGVSFDDGMTANAPHFTAEHLAGQVNRDKQAANQPQLLLIATDGELYGHHKEHRNLFLKHLLRVDAPSRGYTITTPGLYLARYPAAQQIVVREGTSWSCAHGLARWSTGCSCTAGDASWKAPFRHALRTLATSIDTLYEDETRGLLRDPWGTLEDYLDLRDGVVSPQDYWTLHAGTTLRTGDERRLAGLLEMELARQAMFVSCAWFFEDLDRIEPRIALANAHRAITLAQQHTGADLSAPFVADLSASRAHNGRTGAEIYAEFAESVSGVA